MSNYFKRKPTTIKWWEWIILYFLPVHYSVDMDNSNSQGYMVCWQKWRGRMYIVATEKIDLSQITQVDNIKEYYLKVGKLNGPGR